MFGLSKVDGEWVWSDCCPWPYAVRRVRRFVLVSPLPLILRNVGNGYGFRRSGRRALRNDTAPCKTYVQPRIG